jgi:hypothetical protein
MELKHLITGQLERYGSLNLARQIREVTNRNTKGSCMRLPGDFSPDSPIWRNMSHLFDSM